jgi:cell wall assembly regulator SMI1
MEDVLERIRGLGADLPPGASAATIEELEAAVGAALLPELRRLYEAHDGTPEDAALAMRTMPLREVSATDAGIRKAWPELLSPGAIAFWTDDQSNYGGAFLSGDFVGRVFVLDHEQPVETPAFFGVRSFLSALLDDPDAGWLHADYPVVGEARGDHAEADRALGRQCLDSCLRGEADGETLAKLALNAIALVPPEDTERLLPLLESSADVVRARTADVLGRRRCEAALDRLVELARRGGRMARSRSLLALRRLRGAGVEEALARLEKELGPEYSPYFRSGRSPLE